MDIDTLERTVLLLRSRELEDTMNDLIYSAYTSTHAAYTAEYYDSKQDFLTQSKVFAANPTDDNFTALCSSAECLRQITSRLRYVCETMKSHGVEGYDIPK